MVSGIKYQVSSARYQVSGIRFQVSSVRCQVQGIKYRVLGIRNQVSGIGYYVSGIRYQSCSELANALDMFHYVSVAPDSELGMVDGTFWDDFF